MDSDRLFFDDFFSSFAHGTHWSDWRMPPAPGFIPDLALYGFATVFAKTAAARLFITSVAQAFLCCAAAIWLAKLLRGRLTGTMAAGIFLALSAAIINSVLGSMWLFLNSNNVHVSVTLFGILTVAVILRRPSAITVLVLLAVIGCAATLSSALYLIAACIPALTLVALEFVRAVRKNARFETKYQTASFSGLVIGQILAALLRHRITHHDALAGRVPMSLAGMENSFEWFARDLHSIIAGPSVTGKIFALLFVLAAAFVAWRRTFSKTVDDKKIGAAIFFTLASLLFVSVGSIASGGFIDPFSLRYFALPISLTLIIATVYIDNTASQLSRVLSIYILIAMVVGVDIATIPKLHARSGGRSLSEALQLGSGPLPSPWQQGDECIVALDKQGVDLRSGISGYWFSRSIQYLSRQHPMLQMDDTIHPFFWMMNSATFAGVDYTQRFYNFAVVKATQSSTALTIDGNRLPKPSKVFDCPSAQVVILYYADNSLNKLITENNAWYVKSPWFK